MSKPLLLAVALAAGCAGHLSPQLQADVTAKMTRAQPQFSACYQEALGRNRKLQGTIVFAFHIQAQTGVFDGVYASRDELGDGQLKQCVSKAISEIALDKPPGTVIEILSYPLRFAWFEPPAPHGP